MSFPSRPRGGRRTPVAAPALLLGALALLPLTARPAAARPARTHATASPSALYIANLGDGSILRCDGATGKVLSTLGANLMPVGMALGPDHRLYVSSFADGRILRFDPATGKSLGTFIPEGRGGLGNPVCMAFGPGGDLYVGNWKNKDIRRYSGRTGAFRGVFVAHGAGGLAVPGDLTFGPDGDLYVTNNGANDVLRFSGKTGVPRGAFVTARSGGLTNPQNLTFGPDGNLYVGSAGVWEYSGKTGAFKKVFAAAGPRLGNVGGLTFGPDGDLYVGDWQRSDVARYDIRTGAYKGVFVTSASGLESNRYIRFGPRGAGGTPPAVAAAARAARRKAMLAAERAAEARRPHLLAVGTPAPDFAAVAPDGRTVHLSDFKGRPVVLDFWATWCGPCQMSMPHLEKVYQRVKDKGVAVLGVCVWDEKAAYTQWIKDKKAAYHFPTAFDPAGRDDATSIAGHLYHVSGIPTQYIIDKDGHVAAANVGYDPSDHRLEAALTKMGIAVPDQEASAAP